MSSIVVAFPKAEVAQSIKRILAQGGYHVAAVCTSGSQALNTMQDMDHSILVCGPRFQDMMYTYIYENLTNDNQMLLIAQPQSLDNRPPELVALTLPLKVHELLETLRMMDESIIRRKKKQRLQPKQRSAADQDLLDHAKHLLMERNKMTEEEAHRYMQKRSMDNGTGLVETAQMILALGEK